MRLAGLAYVSALWRLALNDFRTGGVADVIRTGMRGIRSLKASRAEKLHPFDLKYGTDTSGIVQPWALNLPGDMVVHAVQYRSAIVDVFLEILHSISIPHREFVFVDLGSGKGRAILLASLLPFKEIIGVELSADLHAVASRNIRIFRDTAQQCELVRSLCQNVVDFEIPREPLVFYLFNPFDDDVIRAIVANVERSLADLPRRIFIAYLKPVYRKAFDESAFLNVMKDTGRYVIYVARTATPL